MMYFDNSKNFRWGSLVPKGKIGRSCAKIILCLAVLLVCGNNLQAAEQTDDNISVRQRQVTLEQVIQHLRSLVKTKFHYEAKDIEDVKGISVNVKDGTLAEVLTQAFEGTNFTFLIKDNTVYVQPKYVSVTPTRVSGKVLDQNNQPLAGAMVLVKGTTVADVTNSKGEYSLLIPANINKVLVCSFVGMETSEVIAAEKVVDFAMMEDAQAMEEVVVYNTGYQTVDKRLSTSSISTIDASDVLQAGTSSVDNMLAGKVAGLSVMNSTSTPGASTSIRIRGTSTISGDREPLWVVDGIILEDPVPLSTEEINSLDNVNLIGNAISGLNPNDIERIDILKDASSTAIYGVSAANGVIVITTKKGSEGPAKVTYGLTTTVTQRPHYGALNLMNSKDRIDVSKEIEQRGLTFGLTPARVGYEGALMDLYDRYITEEEFLNRVKDMEENNTDWYDALYRTALSHKHNLSISGGNSNTSYYISGAYSKDQSTVKGSDVQSMNANAKVISKLGKSVTATVQLRASNSKKDYLHESIDPYGYAYNTSRAIDLYNEDGSWSFYNKKQGNQQQLVYNVLKEISETGYNINANTLNFNANVDWKVFKDLNVIGTVGLNTSNTDSQSWFSEQSYYAADMRMVNYGSELVDSDPFRESQCKLPYGGGLESSSTRSLAYTMRLQANYAKKINDSHEFTLSAGTETRSTKYDGIKGTQYGYLPDRGKSFATIDPTIWLAYKEMVLANPDVVTDRLSNYVSLYGVATYSFKDRYIANFNVRADGSNNFGQDKSARFLPIWSVSAKWNLQNERFLKDVMWLNELAIRSSYGIQGNVSTDQTPNMILQAGSSDAVSGENVYNIYKYANPFLKWEKTESFNVAVDFSFLQNRISGSFEYYDKKGHDQIVYESLSPTVGAATMSTNSGDIRNYGYEIILNAVPVRTKDWTWSLSLNGAKNVNEVVDSGLPKDYTYSDYLGGNIILDGYPVNSFFSYRFDGLDEEGYPTFKGTEEEEGDTKASVFDRILAYSGSRIPDIEGGLGTSLRWKNFTMNMFFSYSLGGMTRLNNLYENSGQKLPNPQQNMSAEFVNRWRVAGDEAHTNIPVLSSEAMLVDPIGGNEIEYGNNLWQMYNNSDLRVVSTDNIRLRTLSLQYSLPMDVCERLRLGAASVRVEGNNLFVIASKELQGQDPDQVAFGSQTTPLLSSYSLVFNITF